jgi:hypothetical protein
MIKLNEQYSINNGQGSIVFSEVNKGTVNALYTITGNKSEGKINGTLDGNVLKGTFHVDAAAGLIEFTFSDDGFDAKWKQGIEPGPMRGKWAGVIISETNDNNKNSDSNILVIELLLKDFTVEDFDQLILDELGILDIYDTIESYFSTDTGLISNYFPDFRPVHKLYCATENEIEDEEECIHYLLSFIQVPIGNEDNFIPENESSLLQISADLNAQINCYIIAEKELGNIFTNETRPLELFQICQKRYQSYSNGEYDEGYYM